MKDINDRLYEHRQDLQHELNTTCLVQDIAEDINGKINELLRSLKLLGNSTSVLADHIFDIDINLGYVMKYLDERYDITSREITILDQILLNKETSLKEDKINPEYVEEFEEMLSDGDIPF